MSPFPFQNIDIGPKHIAAELVLNDDFMFFQGHFPNNPVLPAVAIIDASLELLQRQVPSLSLGNIKLKRCRFTHTIRPGEPVYVDGRMDDKQNWNFMWYDNQRKQVMAQINVLL